VLPNGTIGHRILGNKLKSIDGIQYKCKTMEDIQNMINSGEVNLDGCYIYKFSVKNCIHNDEALVLMPKFSAQHAYFKNGADFSKVQFQQGEVSFIGSKFRDGDVSFDNSKFGDGNVLFENIDFGEGNVSFEHSEFGGGIVSFLNSEFGEGNVSFKFAKFDSCQVFYENVDFGKGEVSFEKVKFGDGRVSFNGAKFKDGEVSFREAEFEDGCIDDVDIAENDPDGGVGVAFKNTSFIDAYLTFDYVNFADREVVFRDAEFTGRGVSFQKAQINGSVSFGGAHTDKYIHFIEAEHIEKANFDGAYIGGEVRFDQATDIGEVSFGRAYVGEVSFHNAHINGEVTFNSTEFGDGDVSFNSAKFKDHEVSFKNIKFGKGKLSFLDTTFGVGGISFLDSKFGDGEVSFESTHFNGANISFAKVIFGEISFNNSTEGNIKFELVQFNGKVDMIVKSCKELKFINCVNNNVIIFPVKGEKEIEELRFDNFVNVGRIQIDWVKNNIEKLIKNDIEKVNQKQKEVDNEMRREYLEMAEQFLLLKENFRSMGKYDEEDLAYVQYKQYERKSRWKWNEDVETGRTKRIIHKIIYPLEWFVLDFIGRYATAPSRILKALIVNILLFGIIYYMLGLVIQQNAVLKMNNLVTGFYFSAITSFTVGFGDVSPNNPIIAGFSCVEAFIGLFLMSYFTVAFARKILR